MNHRVVAADFYGTLACDLSKDRAGIGSPSRLIVKKEWRNTIDGVTVAEGYDWFRPEQVGGSGDTPGNSPFPLKDYNDEGPITLVHECERPDGSTALVVGTPTALYRYLAATGYGVYEDDVFEEDVYVGDSDGGRWVRIGKFEEGGRRWQAVNVGACTIFNNGVDLPVSYNVSELTVTPLYELRELGIARAGCMAGYAGMSHFGDVYEIRNEPYKRLFSPVGVIDAGDILGTVSSGVLTVPSAFFTTLSEFPGRPASQVWVGRIVRFESGEETRIVNWVDEKTVQVSPSISVNRKKFKLYVEFSQVGTPLRGFASTVVGSQTVACDRDQFTSDMVGKTINFENGWSSTITAYIDPRHVTVQNQAPESWSGVRFWVVGTDAKLIEASAPVFKQQHVGSIVYTNSGVTRNIITVYDEWVASTDTWIPMTPAIGFVEPVDTYGRVEVGDCNRFQYRHLWSMLDEPIRFGANQTCSMRAGTNIVVMDNPMRSLKSGMVVRVTGAGDGGTNITGTILLVIGSSVLVLDEVAKTTVTGATLQAADSIYSASGFDDPRGDYSRIVNMLPLAGILVIYKTDSIVLCSYTGDMSSPMTYRWRPIPNSQALYYKNTLVNVGDNVHIYAGRDDFWVFDLASQAPRQHDELQLCKSVFFSAASIKDEDAVFAVDNPLTQEVWFAVPAAIEAENDEKDTVLCWCYGLYKGARTSTAKITAAGRMRRPTQDRSIASDCWFLMGHVDKTLVMYGLSTEPISAWGDKKAIYYRRSGLSANKSGYTAIIESGLGSFGNTTNELHLEGYQLSVHSAQPDILLNVTIIGSDSPSSTPTELFTIQLDNQTIADFVPTHYIYRYFADRIVKPAPVLDRATLMYRNWIIATVGSQGWTRVVKHG